MNYVPFKLHLHVYFAGTFDVQDAEVVIDEGNNSLCLSCKFANGSTARGCVASVNDTITLVATRSPDNEPLTATNCSNNTISGGLYEVLVHDLESDGSLSTHPAVLITVAVPEKGND